MAVGFTPQHQEELPYDGLTPHQFLAIAIQAAQQLEWKLSHTSPNGFIAYTKMSWKSFSHKITLKLEENTVTIKSESTGTEVVDWGRNKKQVDQFITAFSEIKNVVTPEELRHKAEELQQNLVAAEDDILTQPPPTAREGIAGFFSLFIPREDYFITPILVNLNIVLFIAMVSTGVNIMSPDSESLLKWGANFRPVTLNGEWWRLITCCFLHIGILHLLMNMYALVYIGLLLEPYLGRTRFTAAYLLTGITASVASLWWHDNTVSAGASGAIFGMYGVFLAMLTTNLIEKEARTALLTSIGIFVVYNLANGLTGGIDNAAHLGGLAGGLAMGYLFVQSLKKPEAQPLKYLTIAIPALLFTVLTVGAINYIPNTMGIYQQKMKDFGAMEEKALAAYELPESATYEQKVVAFRDSGLYYWNKNLALLHEVEQLDLPIDYRHRNEQLLEYTELRISSYTTIAKMYEENTNEYDTEIEYYNTQLGIVLDSLNGK